MVKSKLNKTRPMFVAVVVLAALVAGGLFVFYTKDGSSDARPQSDITGTVTCLQHKNVDGAQTAECAFGVLLDDGETYYELQDTTEGEGTVSKLPFRKRVRFSGTLDSDKRSEQYNSKGTFDVVKAELVE